VAGRVRRRERDEDVKAAISTGVVLVQRVVLEPLSPPADVDRPMQEFAQAKNAPKC
jgi:hypothetical protein